MTTSQHVRTGPRRALAAALVAALAVVSGAAGAAAEPVSSRPTGDFHPSDGPDIDVRIRIDARAVRLRLSPNLAYVDETTDFVRELEDHLAPEEYYPLLHVLHETFAAHLHVTIDGERVEPRLDGELEVLPALPSMTRYAPIFGALSQTLCTFDLVFPAPQEPTRVAIRWDEELFPPDWSQNSDWALTREFVPPPMEISAQMNDGSGDVPLKFTVTEPELVWHGHVTSALERFLPVVEAHEPETVAVPIPSAVLAAGALLALVALLRADPSKRLRLLALAGGALGASGLLMRVGRVEFELAEPVPVTAEEAVAIFEPLHTNMYTAFDFEDRDEIYDALEHCVAGDQLDRVYQQIFRSLIMQDQGGAESRVQAVRHLETSLESAGHLAEFDADGFTVRTRWQVDGRVTHFGHTHERTQEYAGLFTVGEIDGRWRILGDELLEDFVVDTEPVDLR